jgi:hypothetical protein
MDALKYKVGDKARLVNLPPSLSLRAGEVAEIVRVSAAGKALVKLAKDVGASNKTWWIDNNCLEPVAPQPA